MFAWLIFGFVVLTVLLTSLFKNVNWSDKSKNLLATVFSVIGGALTVILTKGGVDAVLSASIIESALLVYGGSQALYGFILKGTTLEQKMAEVGSGTKENRYEG